MRLGLLLQSSNALKRNWLQRFNMSFLDTDSGRKIFNQYLKKVHGGSQRVYCSEIQQFFDFLAGKNVSGMCHAAELVKGITKETLHAYQEKLSGEHSPKTT